MPRHEVPKGGVGNGTVLLIRHGPVQESWRGVLYGHSDAEAKPLDGIRWEGPDLDHLVSSDLSRAVYSAKSLFPGRPLKTDPDLRETNHGELEGRDLQTLHAEDSTLWDRWLANPDEFQFPGGESYAQVQQRVVGAVERARSACPDDTIGILTHGGPIRSYVAWVLGATAHGIGRLRCAPLHFVEVRFWDGVPVIERANVVGGLLPGASPR